MSRWKPEHSVLLSQLLDIVVGTEETVEIRRDLCKIADSLDTVSDEANSYLTGSWSEGLSLPGSDTDKMSDMNVEVIQQGQAVPQSDMRHLFVMVTDEVHPAFAMLREIAPHTQCAKECLIPRCLRHINGFQFLSSHLVLHSLREKGRDLTQSYDKSPYTNRNVKRKKWQHKQRHKKVRLHSSCGPT